MEKENDLPTEKEIEDRIYLVRGQKVMLDMDLAELYDVATKRLNEQVKRNPGRFPPDFMFQLSDNEWKNLRSQIATSSWWGGRRFYPYVFTEHGVLMLSSVLNSKKAIQVNIRIMRTYTRLRELALGNKEILIRLQELEKDVSKHGGEIQVIFRYLKQLLRPENPPRKKIGFKVKNE
ncbi:MAG TPA: ORF6N domain-containing protein [Bacteroidia bacterium]|jgi:hypothetical protein